MPRGRTTAGHGQVGFIQLKGACSNVVHLPQVRHLLMVVGVAHAGSHIVARVDQFQTDVRSNVASLWEICSVPW